MNTIGKDAVNLTLSKIMTLVISTITSMVLVRIRTLEEYGTYSELMLVINLFSTVFLLGLPGCINYFLARGRTQEEKAKFLSVYYTMSTVLSFILGFVLFLGIPLIVEFFNNYEISKFYYFLALYPWTTIICSSIENILIVYKKTIKLVLFKSIYSIVMLLIVLLVQLFGFGFEEYMIAFVLINCVFAFSVYVIVSEESGGLTVKIDVSYIKEILTFSLPLGLSSMVGTLSTEIDKLLIGKMMSTADLAIYSNAARELPLSIISASITAVLLPQVTVLIRDREIKKAVEMWKMTTELSYIVISITVAGVFVFAEDVMIILFSSKYLPGITVFRIYTLSLLVRCTYFGMILSACGHTREILYCSIANLILNFLLNIIMYYIFGMAGPAIATIISMFIVACILLKITSKVSGLSFSDVFPWKKILIISAVNIVMSAFFCFVKKIINLDIYTGSLVESFIIGVIWIFVYLIILNKRIRRLWTELNKK